MNNRKPRKKNREKSSSNPIADFFGEVLFWVPELLLLPFRLVILLLRGGGRLIRDIVDFI